MIIGGEKLSLKFVDLTQNEQSMIEAITEDCEVHEMQPHIAVDYTDDSQFPKHLFDGMVPQQVDYLPGDIDGKQFFKSKCLTSVSAEKTHDLRNFRMHF